MCARAQNTQAAAAGIELRSCKITTATANETKNKNSGNSNIIRVAEGGGGEGAVHKAIKKSVKHKIVLYSNDGATSLEWKQQQKTVLAGVTIC